MTTRAFALSVAASLASAAFADSGLQMSFQARSVVGGVFLPVLQHPDLVAKYRQPPARVAEKAKGVTVPDYTDSEE